MGAAKIILLNGVYLMPTTSVNLTDSLAEWVAQQVGSGAYKNASEVIREGLRTLKQQDEKNALELDLMRQKILTGLNQADHGDYSKRNVKKIIADTKKKIPALD